MENLGSIMSLVHVAVGVIVSGTDVFLTRRHAEAHQGGKWEFPGGKVEADETVAEALLRELKEEVAIDVLACHPLTVIEHDYGDKQVKLEVFIVDNYQGEPSAQEGNEEAWFAIDELATVDFPDANIVIVNALQSRYK